MFILDIAAFHVVKYPEHVLSSVHITFLLCCCAKEKRGFGEQKNTCMSVVGKHRHLPLKIEAPVLIKLGLARAETNIFTCNSDCTGQSILSEVSSVKEMKQELGMCLSIDRIILLIL